MTNSMSISQANELETRYYAMLVVNTTAKQWLDMSVELDDAADRLIGIDAGHSKTRLREKAEDCRDQSRRRVRGAQDDIYERPGIDLSE